MNEFELIQRYISTAGYRIKDTKFFRQLLLGNGAAPGPFDVGGNIGEIPQHNLFYGNVHLWTEMYPPIGLGFKNMIRINFSTLLYGGVQFTDMDHVMGVNLGLSLMGNGDYSGSKRLYGSCFNIVNFQPDDFDPE